MHQNQTHTAVPPQQFHVFVNRNKRLANHMKTYIRSRELGSCIAYPCTFTIVYVFLCCYMFHQRQNTHNRIIIRMELIENSTIPVTQTNHMLTPKQNCVGQEAR